MIKEPIQHEDIIMNVYVSSQSLNTNEAKPYRTERRNRQFDNHSY